MNDITELKQFASVHSKLQELPDGLWDKTLDRITGDDSGPGSWVHEWSVVAQGFVDSGEFLVASNCYTLARFPFVDGQPRAEAARRSAGAFTGWRAQHPEIERVEVTPPAGLDGQLGCWAAGLSGDAQRPLLLFMGGIVSLKEQWAQLLLLAEPLEVAMVVCEMPGVGENSLPYRKDSWRMLPAILDALAPHADVARTFAVANSFSGHLALRCATEDRRIRGIISNAAPISEFFTDADWLRGIPAVTTDTLAHLTGVDRDSLVEVLKEWALTADELSSLEIPVAYMASLQDEIIPFAEVGYMRKHVRNLDTKVWDDVHASPSHLLETRQWMLGSLARMRSEQG